MVAEVTYEGKSSASSVSWVLRRSWNNFCQGCTPALRMIRDSPPTSCRQRIRRLIQSENSTVAPSARPKKDAEDNEGLVLNAQLAVDGKAGKYSEFKDNVATVYTHPLSQGGGSNSYYGVNAKTCINVGKARGKAMVELMKNKPKDMKL